MVLMVDGIAHETSRAATPLRSSPSGGVYHGACYRAKLEAAPVAPPDSA
jgi:hypothetical protein